MISFLVVSFQAEKVSEELLELKQNVLVKQIVLQQDSQNAQPELLGGMSVHVLETSTI